MDKERLQREEARTVGAVRELERLLRIKKINRIEAYDISHISGTSAVGAMVVYENGYSKRVDYRKFRIDGANDFISYKEGPVGKQALEMTNGQGFDKVIIAGGTVDTFAEAIEALKAGGRIGNVNYLGTGEYVKIPREQWGVGMGHKQIFGGLMPGGRRRLERLSSVVLERGLDPSLMITHPFKGFEHIEDALMLMKDKPKDLIKPVVIL